MRRGIGPPGAAPLVVGVTRDGVRYARYAAAPPGGPAQAPGAGGERLPGVVAQAPGTVGPAAGAVGAAAGGAPATTGDVPGQAYITSQPVVQQVPPGADVDRAVRMDFGPETAGAPGGGEARVGADGSGEQPGEGAARDVRRRESEAQRSRTEVPGSSRDAEDARDSRGRRSYEGRRESEPRGSRSGWESPPEGAGRDGHRGDAGRREDRALHRERAGSPIGSPIRPTSPGARRVNFEERRASIGYEDEWRRVRDDVTGRDDVSGSDDDVFTRPSAMRHGSPRGTSSPAAPRVLFQEPESEYDLKRREAISRIRRDPFYSDTPRYWDSDVQRFSGPEEPVAFTGSESRAMRFNFREGALYFSRGGRGTLETTDEGRGHRRSSGYQGRRDHGTGYQASGSYPRMTSSASRASFPKYPRVGSSTFYPARGGAEREGADPGRPLYVGGVYPFVPLSACEHRGKQRKKNLRR